MCEHHSALRIIARTAAAVSVGFQANFAESATERQRFPIMSPSDRNLFFFFRVHDPGSLRYSAFLADEHGQVIRATNQGDQ